MCENRGETGCPPYRRDVIHGSGVAVGGGSEGRWRGSLAEKSRQASWASPSTASGRPIAAIETARLVSGGILALLFSGVNGVVQEGCGSAVVQSCQRGRHARAESRG